MRTTTHTARRLVLDHTPLGLGLGAVVAILVMLFIVLRALEQGNHMVALVVGASTLLFPGGVFLVLTREQLILDRDLGEIIIRRRNLLYGFKEEHYPLMDLRGTTIQWRDTRGSPRRYRMALVLGPPPGDSRTDILDGAQQVVPFWDWDMLNKAQNGAAIVKDWLSGNPGGEA